MNGVSLKKQQQQHTSAIVFNIFQSFPRDVCLVSFRHLVAQLRKRRIICLLTCVKRTNYDDDWERIEPADLQVGVATLY